MLTRRLFLHGSAIAMAGAGSVPFWLGRAAANTGARRKVLVAIFQRGAADGLNVVVPFAEKRYYELRPTLAIASPSSGNNGVGPPAIDLDGRFGLNPVLEPFKDLWDRQMLAIVEATGSPDPSRSHFDAQDYMESGTPGMKRDGWLNRALPPSDAGGSPLRAISISANLPRTLQGDFPAIAINDMKQFSAGASNAAIVERMYAASPDKPLAMAGKDAFAAMRRRRLVVRDPDKALAYLRRAVVNGSRSALRPRTVQDRNPAQSLPGMPGAGRGAIARLATSAMAAALGALPRRQREAVVLRYYADLSETETAAAMGISEGAVKNHAHRGMAALARRAP